MAAVEKPEKFTRRLVKNSVFCDLFGQMEYLLELYRALHPEDGTITEEDIADVTIENVLTNNLYNDLGFTVRDRLIILVEAQSTWTKNILVRSFLYLAESYKRYIKREEIDLYKSKKAELPKPELYVIYTGDTNVPSEISLKDEFFSGGDCAVDVKVKVISGISSNDIISQYIIFSKVVTEQIKIHGRTREAVVEAIRICKDRNVLVKYLSEHETEVISMSMFLFDQDEIMRLCLADNAREVLQNANIESAKRMLKRGKLSLEEIAEDSNLPLSEIEKLARLQSV